MATLNYSPVPGERQDTYPHFALPEELVAAEWATSPTVTVPAIDFLYAVDQAKLAPKHGGRGFAAPEKNQTVFQFQRWVDVYHNERGTDQNVGDWLIAPRILVERGEFVKTPSKYALEIPVYLLGSQGHLKLDTRPVDKRPGRRKERTDQMPIQFGDDSLLIDFEDKAEYKREEAVGEKTKLITLRQSYRDRGADHDAGRQDDRPQQRR